MKYLIVVVALVATATSAAAMRWEQFRRTGYEDRTGSVRIERGYMTLPKRPDTAGLMIFFNMGKWDD